MFLLALCFASVARTSSLGVGNESLGQGNLPACCMPAYVTLFAASIVAVSVLAWLFRQRFIKHLPSKETMSTFCLVAPIVLLLLMAILPDVLLLIGTLALMPPTIRTIIGIAAATVVIYAGCPAVTANRAFYGRVFSRSSPYRNRK